MPKLTSLERKFPISVHHVMHLHPASDTMHRGFQNVGLQCSVIHRPGGTWIASRSAETSSSSGKYVEREGLGLSLAAVWGILTSRPGLAHQDLD